MEGLLADRSFVSFYEKLSSDAQTIATFFKNAKNAMGDIAKQAHIGGCEIFINSPATPYDVRGSQDSCVLYGDADEFDDDNKLRETYVTNDWGIIQIEFYPEKDHLWSQNEKDEIMFLMKILYDCCIRVRDGILMRQAVISDNLTGACNRAGVIAYLNDMIQNESIGSYTAVYYNIKNFNYINQKIGNIQGDKVLKDYSHLIRESLVKGELFGRLGGDTFFVLAENDRVEDLLKFITTRKIAVEIDKVSHEFDMAVRVGVYRIKPQDSAVMVIDASKTAYMMTRQPSYGDVVWFVDDMLRESMKDEEISNAFNRALKRKEFIVYFQPKVELSKKRLVSAEALCRWVRNGEVVPPMEFIPTLERSGAICRLDFYVLERVCENIVDWLSRGVDPVRTSVNFSRSHILNRKLAGRIKEKIEEYGVDPKYIEIEITEMSGYENFEQLQDFVDAMKEYGINTSIDDFGTGYSSLSLIKDLKVDTIKLDKSFLSSIENATTDQDRSVIKNVVNMVRELDMQVVAEGVETQAQMDFLKEVDCQLAQGFLFDRPMPVEEFELKLMGERMY